MKELFGYDSFRGHQAEIINTILLGHDALVLMPTGGGKSLCYQIPALLRPGVGIVISPLIALMEDQVFALLQAGVRAAYLNSTLDYNAVLDIEHRLRHEQLDLLYIAPERLFSERTWSLLARLNIALFAIDEAHCVSQWGHDFRPEYLQLNALIDAFPHVPRLALTATADKRTREEIRERLGLSKAKTFISSFDRPEGFRALPYHAGFAANIRAAHQRRFLQEEGVIMVATIAFGMGIDKPNVRFVAHLDLPKSLEAYYQETGRAGRDGLSASAWMVYGLQDVMLLRNFTAQSTATESHKRVEHHKLEAMLAFCETTACRRVQLLNYFDEAYPEDCGNCDSCLSPAATWDASIAVQKALSCIYRTGQRFGVNYLIDVLLGKPTERITQFGHHRLSTYGIGKELSPQQWRSLFRQIIARGYVSVDNTQYGSLQLTADCRPILQGKTSVTLRALREVRSRSSVNKPKSFLAQFNEFERQLWLKLRAVRQSLANEQKVPPYVIFHDVTLKDMVEQRPQTPHELLALSGVGEHKLKNYGESFLAVLRNTWDEHSIP
ncbi:MAG: RecQ family ATP-dependent DNA helicase [Gammaproteobacteria bacterium]